MPTPTSSRKAFTVIEMLMVGAILSILVALLAPHLGRAKEIATMTQCENNLHNNGMAISLFGRNHKEAYPDFFYSFDPGNNQANTVVILYTPKKAASTGWTYLDPTCMVCPDDAAPGAVHVLDPVNGSNGSITDFPCSYDVNVDFLIREHTQDGTAAPSALALLFDGNIGAGAKQGAYLGTDEWTSDAFVPRHLGTKYGSVLWADGHATHEPRIPLSAWVMQGDAPWVHGNAGGNK